MHIDTMFNWSFTCVHSRRHMTGSSTQQATAGGRQTRQGGRRAHIERVKWPQPTPPCLPPTSSTLCDVGRGKHGKDKEQGVEQALLCWAWQEGLRR